MGTEFRIILKPAVYCPCCETLQEEEESIVIGKRSNGWVFEFRGTDDIRSLEDWLKFIGERKVTDEYSREYNAAEFIAVVFETLGRKTDRKHTDWIDSRGFPFWYDSYTNYQIIDLKEFDELFNKEN